MKNPKKNAGEFSIWLNEFTQTMKGEGPGDVPCGNCVGCCTSSKFIHIRPSDKKTLRVIPQKILFEAPGLPKGHYLLGYDEKGYCPMFKDSKCSIYDCRPETCKQYDCRVFAATQTPLNDESLVIQKQIKAWEFTYATPESLKAQNAISTAMLFLINNSKAFPPNYLPQSKSQLAVMAVRIHTEFFGHSHQSTADNPKALINKITSKYNNK